MKRESLGLELSAFELGALSGMVQNELHGWYVNNVYPLTDEGLLIRFHRSEAGDKNLAIHPRIAIWLTKAYHEHEGEIPEFCRSARRHLTRYHLVTCKVLRGERIVAAEFEHVDRKLKMFAEFFGAGNIIITDQEMKILAILHEIESKERILKPGLNYEFPKPRKLPLDSLTPETLIQGYEKGVSLSRFIGSKVQLPERVIREMITRSNLREDTVLDPSSASLLISTLKEMEEEAGKASVFYLYEVEGKKVLSSLLLTHIGNPSDTLLPERLDQIFTSSLTERASFKSEALERIEKERKRIESARKMHETTLEKARRLKEIAETISMGEVSFDEIGEMLSASGSSISYKNGSWFVDGRRKEFESRYSLASELFSESKKMLASAEQIQESIKRMEKELAQREAELSKRPLPPQVRTKKKWFEAYRWFLTSESFFAVGGRDAGSNSLLIRKKLSNEDLVFHAEIVGSPFFILKKGKLAGQASLREAAVATVSYSRAWREGLRAADAYYVEPSQVKLGAPSGQYLPRGSFVIEGQRNYLKDLKLALGVGITRLEEAVVACSGPVTSLVKYSPVVVEIAPGNIKPQALAKKLIRILEQHLSGFSIPSPDEFMKVLPPGDSEIVAVKKGEGDRIGELQNLIS
ncbi:MAG: ribosome rescue protein RqcH [Conexivisphaerales archaeon]